MKLIYASVGLLATKINVSARPQVVEKIVTEEQVGIFEPEPILEEAPLPNVDVLIDSLSEEMELAPILIEDNYEEVGEETDPGLDSENSSGAVPELEATSAPEMKIEDTPLIKSVPEIMPPKTFDPPKMMPTTAPVRRFIQPSGNVVTYNEPSQYKMPNPAVITNPTNFYNQRPPTGYKTSTSNSGASSFYSQNKVNKVPAPNYRTMPASVPLATPKQPYIWRSASVPAPIYTNVDYSNSARSTKSGPSTSSYNRPNRAGNNSFRPGLPPLPKPLPFREFQQDNNPALYQPPPLGNPPIWESNNLGPGGSYQNPYYIWKDNARPFQFKFKYGEPREAPFNYDDADVLTMGPENENNKFWVSKCRCWKTCPDGFVWNYNRNRCSKDYLRERANFFEEFGKN